MRQPKYIADTKRCPFCNTWVPVPLRRQRQAIEQHMRDCNRREFRRVQRWTQDLLDGKLPPPALQIGGPA